MNELFHYSLTFGCNSKPGIISSPPLLRCQAFFLPFFFPLFLYLFSDLYRQNYFVCGLNTKRPAEAERFFHVRWVDQAFSKSRSQTPWPKRSPRFSNLVTGR